MKRRQFIKTCAAGLALAGTTPFLTPDLPAMETTSAEGNFSQFPQALTAKRWGMAINTKRLSPAILNKMITACHSYHNVPSIAGPREVKWLWADTYARSFPDQLDQYPANRLNTRSFPLLCNHCENPPCVRVCPTKATFKQGDGTVVMDYHRCIGCRFCMAGCPYGARSFNFSDPQPFVEKPNPLFPMRMRGVVEKCTFCSELLAKGEMPLCARTSRGAIIFGDLGDPNSPLRRTLAANVAVRRKPSLGTQPSVYYIL